MTRAPLPLIPRSCHLLETGAPHTATLSRFAGKPCFCGVLLYLAYTGEVTPDLACKQKSASVTQGTNPGTDHRARDYGLSPAGISSWPRSNRRNDLRAGGGRSEVGCGMGSCIRRQFDIAAQRTPKNQIRGAGELTGLEVGAGFRSPGSPLHKVQ